MFWCRISQEKSVRLIFWRTWYAWGGITLFQASLFHCFLSLSGHVQSRVVYYLMNIHVLPRTIYITRVRLPPLSACLCAKHLVLKSEAL